MKAIDQVYYNNNNYYYYQKLYKSKRAHKVNAMSYQLRCNVMPLYQLWYDVALTSCAAWKLLLSLSLLPFYDYYHTVCEEHAEEILLVVAVAFFFKNISLISRWVKTGVAGEKPIDLAEAELFFRACDPSKAQTDIGERLMI